MAEASDITDVRENVDEPDDSNGWTDIRIGDLVDELGVSGASAAIWRKKAAKLIELADVTEAGASHKFTDLHKNALAMAKHYDGLLVVAEVPTGPVVNEIVRET